MDKKEYATEKSGEKISIRIIELLNNLKWIEAGELTNSPEIDKDFFTSEPFLAALRKQLISAALGEDPRGPNALFELRHRGFEMIPEDFFIDCAKEWFPKLVENGQVFTALISYLYKLGYPEDFLLTEEMLSRINIAIKKYMASNGNNLIYAMDSIYGRTSVGKDYLPKPIKDIINNTFEELRGEWPWEFSPESWPQQKE